MTLEHTGTIKEIQVIDDWLTIGVGLAPPPWTETRPVQTVWVTRQM